MLRFSRYASIHYENRGDLYSAVGCELGTLYAQMSSKISIEAIDDKRFTLTLSCRWFPRYVKCDGESLTILSDAAFTFPLRDIRAIACVPHRGLRWALQITVEDGALRVLTGKDRDLLRSIADELRRRLKVEQLTAGKLPTSHVADEAQTTHRFRAVSLVFLTPMLLAAGWFSDFVIRPGWKSHEWPTASGRVIESRYEQLDGDRNKSRYAATIRYAYSINGKTFESDRIQFGAAKDNAVSRRVVLGHQPGAAIDVAYDPLAPERATIVRGAHRQVWVVLGLASILLIPGTIVVGFQRSTLAQDLLLRKYCAPQGVRRTSNSPVIVSWTEPNATFEHRRRKVKRYAIRVAIRLPVTCALLVATCLHFAIPLAPELPWIRLVVFLSAFILMLSAATLWSAFAPASPRTFSIHAEGFSRLRETSSIPTVRWERFASFDVQPEPDLTNARSLRLVSTSGHAMSIPLPGGELDTQVISTVASRISHRTAITDSAVRLPPSRPSTRRTSCISRSRRVP